MWVFFCCELLQYVAFPFLKPVTPVPASADPSLVVPLNATIFSTSIPPSYVPPPSSTTGPSSSTIYVLPNRLSRVRTLGYNRFYTIRKPHYNCYFNAVNTLIYLSTIKGKLECLKAWY